jgi:hypothetical protein
MKIIAQIYKLIGFGFGFGETVYSRAATNCMQ